MMSNNFFNLSAVQALAMLYTEKHATENHTPEDLCQLYFRAYYAISKTGNGIVKKMKKKSADKG